MLALVTGAALSFSTSTYPSQSTSTYTGTALAITFSDCGENAHAVVKSISPKVLPLGSTTAFTGAGTNTGEITGSSWTMKMTGVGGSVLLSCSGADATKPATCPISLGPIHVGTAAFGGIKFPQESGDITLTDIVSITLPKGLPSFATKTETTLTSTAQDGKQAFCVKILSAPTEE